MDTVTFDRLLLKTAFCCMASDGKIVDREIAVINSLCRKSPLFKDFDFQKELNKLVKRFNAEGKKFIAYFFDLLKNTILTEEEELTLIDWAIRTIQADEVDDYSEIKFFKIIRRNLKISNEKILAVYPNIEQFLEEDIVIESDLEKILNQYLELAEIPQFELISLIDDNTNDSKSEG